MEGFADEDWSTQRVRVCADAGAPSRDCSDDDDDDATQPSSTFASTSSVTEPTEVSSDVDEADELLDSAEEEIIDLSAVPSPVPKSVSQSQQGGGAGGTHAGWTPASMSQPLRPIRTPHAGRAASATTPVAQGTLNSFVVRDAMAMMMASAKHSPGLYPGKAPRSASASKSTTTPAGQKRPRRASGGALSARKVATPAPTRPCPFYKRVPGTPFVVDGFHFAHPSVSRHYILTHYHSDHYGGINKHFDAGKIYCTPATSALVREKLGVKATHLVPIDFHKPTVIEGVTVTFLPANHCPGAAMVLFELPSRKAYLHVGDFRWSPAMKRYKELRQYAGDASSIQRLDALYLDTTYCDPRYSFPPQEACVAAVLQTALKYAEDPGVLFLFGSYTIGKERVYMEVARKLKEKIYVDKTRMKTMMCLGLPLADMAMFTCDPAQSRIHVVPMGYITLNRLHTRLQGLQKQAESAAAAAARTPFAELPQNTPGAAAVMGRCVGIGKFISRSKESATVSTAVQRGKYFQALTGIQLQAALAGGIAQAQLPLSHQGSTTGISDADEELGGFLPLMAPSPTPKAVTPGGASALGAPRTFGPFHSIVGFKPTGWAASGSSAAAELAAGDTLAFLDVNVEDVSAWDRRADAEDDIREDRAALNALKKADSVPVSEVREMRKAGVVEARVLLDGEEFLASELFDSWSLPADGTAASVAGSRPAAQVGAFASTPKAPAPLRAAITSRIATVRMTHQMRGGGAAVRPPAAGASLRGGISVFSVPYSEHSSFTELRDCVQWLDPLRIVPTVNCRSAEDATRLVSLLRGHAGAV